ncbi:hypothetical protein EUGRSUZ_C03947 [Eucalyptus grandis]|uniref:Uncharacterized protein n=2 Tax=Eucalyptus grandis TaxID=71139 RepID=A0ACC3LJY8_EUCGR|nr:hypothetical protein EUGRSUZ_C03947 [Eucalyptus grandis]
MMMEGVEGDAAAVAAAPRYVLNPARISSEDILFCVDVDAESLVEMKATGPGGRPFARLDAIKQSLLLFVHSKLAINPDHRFAFATLSKSAAWLRKEFSSDVESAAAAIRSLSATSACGHADLTQLFRIAAHEAKKSRMQNRIFRVILIYCTNGQLTKSFSLWMSSTSTTSLDQIIARSRSMMPSSMRLNT